MDKFNYRPIGIIHSPFKSREGMPIQPIGMSVVRLIQIERTTLSVQDIDIIDKTPLLDIKPFVPDFDMRKVERTGWLEKKAANAESMADDGRFGD